MTPELAEIITTLPFHAILMIAIYALWRKTEQQDREQQELMNKLILELIEVKLHVEQSNGYAAKVLAEIDSENRTSHKTDAGR